MAAVYQARDTKRGTLCAIKEMSLSTVAPDERPKAIQNFLAEARILSRLNHPNLPAFTDFFTEGARHFLVMEYIDGSTLDDLLERNGGPFSERRVLGWARQLCDVLEYLHSQQPPVIFRDMKPSNVMLTRTGRIKLIDFGIARLFRSSGAQDTQLLGTPGYAPPEQYGTAQTDERSDIYSLAMTLFHLMTNSISENGFGLEKVHENFPQISPPVARALEKATTLRLEDRYDSIVVFRRALLGVGTFRFENGGEATTPEELAELCARYPEEASDYLFSGEVESWLQEIGENDLARATRRIRTTVGDPEMGVTRFLQAVMGPGAHIRTSTPPQAANGSRGDASSTQDDTGIHLSIPGSRGSRSGRTRDPGTAVIVRPKTIDFGQVYPGLSAPMLLTISGVKGALVSGTIHAVESWIITDLASFDGMSTPVRVRVDSTRLAGSAHYTGKIIITPDDSEREITVTVEVEVLGHTTASIPAGIRPVAATAGRTAQPLRTLGASTLQADDDGDAMATTASGMRMAPQATIADADSAFIAPAKEIEEYKTKYGLPGRGGWEPLQTSARQSTWMKYILTFLAAFMAGGFFYMFLAYLPPLVQAHISLLAPNPWFIAIPFGMWLFATLGALIANWSTTSILKRIGTGLGTSLVILVFSQLAWQNLSIAPAGPAPRIQLVLMLFMIALGAAIGTAPGVSEQIIRRGIWMMQRMLWLVLVLGAVAGGSLGYVLTSGFDYNCFAPLGAILGAGGAVLLVLRIDRWLKQNP